MELNGGSLNSLRIVVDKHEPDFMPALLLEMGMAVDRRKITPGDYILSSECAVERKTVGDFVNSVYSGRVFEQVESLRTTYSKPILILEGDFETELSLRKNPRAFWGALLRLQSDMCVPVMSTPTPLHTANLLYTLARRLQKKKNNSFNIQHKPRIMSERDWQIYVVASLPNIGDELATRILQHFGNIRDIFTAGEFDLTKVDGIGRVKARRIIKLLNRDFRKLS